MTFGQSIKHVFDNYANFNGRASRNEFWWFFLFYVLVSAGAGILDRALFTDNSVGPLGGLWWLATIVPVLALGARRLHDSNKSGWMQLLYLVPCAGGIIMLVFFALEGTPGPNPHGERPVA